MEDDYSDWGDDTGGDWDTGNDDVVVGGGNTDDPVVVVGGGNTTDGSGTTDGGDTTGSASGPAGTLYFNNETGEWYTLGEDTPLDANGNPIIGSDGSIAGATKEEVGGTNWLKGVGNWLSGTGPLGVGGQLLALGGMGSLLNKVMGGGSGSGGFKGYSGGIPSLTATRTQTPIAEQRPTSTVDGKTVPYRPGQGGITYFSPMTFAPTPPAATTTTDPAATTAPPTADPTSVGGGNAAGGLLGLARGGRFLRGPGDGVSDSIPATIGRKQPARLADGEFVLDARTVSEIGNGSSEAGARKLYQMMERVHSARRRATRGKPSRADRYLPK